MRKLFTLLFLALSLSAFSTSITFELSMKGSGVTYDSVFVVGSQTDWLFVQMVDQGDSLFTVSMNLPEGDTAVYYFITIGYWASDYLDYRETVPLDCDNSMELVGWEGDRAFIVPASPVKISNIWGTCDEVPGVSAIKVTNNNEKLDLFPNPTEGNVTVQLPEFTNFATIEILDLSGKSIRSIDALAKEFTFDVSDLTKGIYIVKVSSGDAISYGKMVVR
jgi:hypothetical protein